MADILLKSSTVPLLFVIQILAIGMAARRAERVRELRSVGVIHAILLMLVVWGVCVAWLALNGTLAKPAFLRSYPFLWMPFIPVILTVAPVAAFPNARRAVRALVDETPTHWLTGIHALRILAIGSIVKALRGDFPASFATYVGGPDLLFGLSALPVTWLVVTKRIGARALTVWHILGAAVIIPGAILVGQMGLPGAFHIFEDVPPIATLFEFPIVLAPALVVPLFVTMNLLVAVRLIERRKAR